MNQNISKPQIDRSLTFYAISKGDLAIYLKIKDNIEQENYEYTLRYVKAMKRNLDNYKFNNQSKRFKYYAHFDFNISSLTDYSNNENKVMEVKNGIIKFLERTLNDENYIDDKSYLSNFDYYFLKWKSYLFKEDWFLDERIPFSNDFVLYLFRTIKTFYSSFEAYPESLEVPFEIDKLIFENDEYDPIYHYVIDPFRAKKILEELEENIKNNPNQSFEKIELKYFKKLLDKASKEEIRLIATHFD